MPESAGSAENINNTPAPAPIIRDEAPIISALKWSRKAIEKVGGGLVGLGRGTESILDKGLNHNQEESVPEYAGIIKTPFKAIGHIIDGTIGNIARRAKEIITPDFHQTAAATRLTAGNILRPTRAFEEPKERIFKPIGRIITSIGKRIEATIAAIPRTIGEFWNRSVRNSFTQINYQLDRIPILGQGIAKITNFIADSVHKITGGIRDGVDDLLSPFNKAHLAMAPAA